MWNTLFHPKSNDDKVPEPSTEEKGNKAVTFHGDTDEDFRKPKRVSKSWVQTPLSGNDLTEKLAQYNLLDEEDINLQSASSTSAHLMAASSSNHSKRYLNLLEPKRITSRPIFIIRKSDSDILRFKEDNFDKARRENKGCLFYISKLRLES